MPSSFPLHSPLLPLAPPRALSLPLALAIGMAEPELEPLPLLQSLLHLLTILDSSPCARTLGWTRGPSSLQVRP